MEDFFKGETVIIKRKSFRGVDAGNNPKVVFVELVVDDVLVSYKNTDTTGTLIDPVLFKSSAILRFKPNVDLQDDDIYVVRGTQWAQDGLPIQPEPSGFRRGNQFLINRRTTVKVTQVVGEK